MDLPAMQAMAKRIRGRVIAMSHRAESAHLGSCLSCIDILVALYFSILHFDPAAPQDFSRDRCILSKGHAANALYAALALRGFFPESLLDTLNEDGSPLFEHPCLNAVPGIEASTGSLGHGLPIALGMALAGRIHKLPYRCFAILSDGECQEGAVWEAALFAAAQRLDRVTAIIDFNRWQATGRSEQIMAIAPLKPKWEAFGWHAVEVDGHDLSALTAALSQPADKPTAIIAHTIKGKGVSFMEDDNNWHYRIPNSDEVKAAWKELGLQ